MVLWNNKLDERWALMNPNQYHITVPGKTQRVMRHQGDVCFRGSKGGPARAPLIEGQI